MAESLENLRLLDISVLQDIVQQRRNNGVLVGAPPRRDLGDSDHVRGIRRTIFARLMGMRLARKIKCVADLGDIAVRQMRHCPLEYGKIQLHGLRTTIRQAIRVRNGNGKESFHEGRFLAERRGLRAFSWEIERPQKKTRFRAFSFELCSLAAAAWTTYHRNVGEIITNS